MTDEEKLKKSRNLIRYLLRKMSNELDIKYREPNSRFFSDLMNRCVEVGVIRENGGVFRLTDKEHTENDRKGARHRGYHSIERRNKNGFSGNR